MSRASSHALKHPPVTAPSEPVGATPFPELDVAIERERRRGRGAQSNASGRFEAEARIAFDDGWQSLEELPPFKTTVTLDTSRMAKRNLVKVALSVTTLDPKLARTMEPRASTPPKRLEALRQLAEAGIPATVMVAPVIPALNDSEIERILDAAAHAGAKEASYVLLRLPLEVRDLFREWLMANYPDRYRHVFTLIRDMRGGRDYDSQWGT